MVNLQLVTFLTCPTRLQVIFPLGTYVLHLLFQSGPGFYVQKTGIGSTESIT